MSLLKPTYLKVAHMTAKHFITGDFFRPLHDTLFVSNLDHGVHKTRGGIILLDDNMTDRGIHDRWAQVWAVGPEISDLIVGEWVLVKHGRWTTGIEMLIEGKRQTIWKIDYPDAIMLVTDVDPRAMTTTL